MRGRAEVGTYLHDYASAADWHFRFGLVVGLPAALVYDPDDRTGEVAYFVLLEWSGEALVTIRDFRYARYAAERAEVQVLGPAER